MRLITIMASCVLLSFGSAAQTKAVTESGEEVVLYKDGTWKSADAPKASWNTRLDTLVVQKGEKNTFLVKGKKVKYGVWIDPKKWKFSGEYNPSIPFAEYFFTGKDGDVYAMSIPEGMELTYDALLSVSLKMAQNADPGAHVTNEETRMVNGAIVKYVEMKASNQGVDLVYLGYYYTGKKGTVRLLAFTTENLIDKYKKDILDLLSGFTMDVK